MKKTMKKTIAMLLALVIILTVLAATPFTASAAVSTVPQLESSRLEVLADPEGRLNQADAEEYLAVYKNSNPDTVAVAKAFGTIQPSKITTSTSVGGGSIGGGSSLTTSTNHFWFFPSTADLTSLKIWFAEGTTVTIDGTEIQSGVPTDIFRNLNEGGTSQNFTIKIGNSSYTTTVVKSGDVGTIYIDTQSGSLSTINSAALSNGSADTSVYESGMIMVIAPDGTVDYCGAMEKMSGRGNGTWSTSGVKNPYNIKLAASTSLLGMNSAKKWSLLASTGTGSDSYLVRNQMTYDFADYIGVKYQPHCKPVDLYVNQQYIGSYQLAEKVEIKSNRVNLSSDAYESLEIMNGEYDETIQAIVPKDLTGTAVTSYNPVTTNTKHNQLGHNVGAKKYSPSLNEPSDYTGGFIYELEINNRWVEENAGFCSYNRQGWVVKSADYLSTNMVNYSYDLLYALGSAVYNNGTVPSTSTTTNCSKLTESTYISKYYGYKSITNPAPATEYQGKKWSDLLDADSAVRYYWTQEFFKNMDASTSSTYFYKDCDSVDGKLYAGPVWDMDNSIAGSSETSRWGVSLTSTDAWYVKNSRIYRWRVNDTTKTYSSDDYAPLTFYGALATNCSDFWKMAEKYYYLYISPAVDVLLGNAEDASGTLHSIEYYVNTIQKSANMDALRYGTSYDASSVISTLTQWISGRQSYINSQISTINLSTATIANISSKTFTGKPIEPSVSVSVAISGEGNVVLSPETDYTLTYENNINAGTATAVVTGKGMFIGTATKDFVIQPSNLALYHTLTIDSQTYAGLELTAVIRNGAGEEIIAGDSATYQWYRNSTAIDGATEQTYLVTDDDKGASITCVATGDEVNLRNSVESNACAVSSEDRPTGYTRTIASWDYTLNENGEALVTADETGATYYYTATGGENQDTSNLYASVNAVDATKLKWSGTADLYTNDGVKDQAPVMGTSKTDGLAWGEYPYFETVVSTAGYENIKFSAKLGGTKKGPRDWKLQYSLDGTTYTDIEGAVYSITTNKAMELAFDNVELPDECTNQLTLYIRMVVTSNVAINNVDTIVNITSGDAAVNNIAITGASLSIVTSLYAPTISAEENETIFNDGSVEIFDNNGGADIYYSVNGGEPMLYTGAVNPFNAGTDAAGTTAVISAYAKFEDIQSDTATATVVFGGTNINSFSYNTYSKKVTNGAVRSTGGVYGESGRMTAYADGTTQYVPLWKDKNKAFCVAPDDGLVWTENSGFTYKVSTAGFDNITFTCKAYTTASGPKSVTLQYSLDGEDFTNISSNVVLPANKVLEQFMVTAPLPAACNDKTTLYIRLATTEDSTKGDETTPITNLHNNQSKGNLYINDIIVAGDNNGNLKMPYTNKSTNYFGLTGTVKYVSPDGADMQYIVKDSSDNIVLAGTYPMGGIKLSSAENFDKSKQEPYTILIQAVDEEETSYVNAATYYYKGETVTQFICTSIDEFNTLASADALSVQSVGGANSGTLAMYADAQTPAQLTYTGTYGIKAGTDTANIFTATKNLDNPDNNSYWLIQTSSLGYKNLSLNLEQLSSDKGPRDWGIAYSTDGSTYTYVSNSNVRTISNDGLSAPVETYGNLPLPSACDNQENLYIKVFVNGGETVDGTEIALAQKGYTGINSIELSGIPLPQAVEVNVVLPQGKNGTVPQTAVSNAEIYVNGNLAATTDANGVADIELTESSTVTVKYAQSERTFTADITRDTTEMTIVLQLLDANNDGYVNAKDFAIVNKDSRYDAYKPYFQQYINQTAQEAYNQ